MACHRNSGTTNRQQRTTTIYLCQSQIWYINMLLWRKMSLNCTSKLSFYIELSSGKWFLLISQFRPSLPWGYMSDKGITNNVQINVYGTTDLLTYFVRCNFSLRLTLRLCICILHVTNFFKTNAFISGWFQVLFYYAKMPMQYTAIFKGCDVSKACPRSIFQSKNKK